MTGEPQQSGLPDISLVIPCYNEEEVLENTITRLVRVFKAVDAKLELILVDNGSSDSTGEIIDQMTEGGFPIKKVRIDINEGYGNGILMGLPACTGPWVGFTCADGQVEAEDVLKVYEIAAKAKHPHLVKVRRRFRMDGFTRKVISSIYNYGTLILFGGLQSIDINGNPKIIPSSYLKQMNLESRDWFLDAEIMIKAKALKLPVLEINVFAQMREGGVSHVKAGTCWEFAANLLKYRFGKANLDIANASSN